MTITTFFGSRFSWACALLAVFLQLTSVGARAANALDRLITLDVPKNTPLEDALIEWGTKVGVTVMANTTAVEHQTTQGIHGTLRAGAMLSVLLRGSGLSYVAEGGRILIAPVGTFVRSSQRDEAQELSSARANSEAQTNQASAGDTTKNFELVASNTRNGPRQTDIDEVIVTAQKRNERLFDVPMSIVAVSSDELEKRNIVTIDDLFLAVPGIGGESSSGLNRQIFLRGVGNVNGNSSLVGLYLDESDVTAFPSWLQPDLRTYDLERVEVLRGPQGTLYGEGSVGGTIRFITKNPQLDSFAMDADVAALFTQDGAPSQRIESVVNMPLIDNVLGVRVVGTFDHEGGWIKQPAANVKDFNSQNLVDVRTKVLWQVSSQFAVNAMALVHRNDTAPDFGEDANGNYTQQFNLTLTPNVQDDYDIYSLTLTYKFPAARLLSTTSYMDIDKDLHNNGRIFQTTPPGTEPFSELDLRRILTQHQLNEELRLTSTNTGPWQWTIGGSYRHARYGDNFPAVYYALQGPPGSPLPALLSLGSNGLSRSESIFGDTSYKLTDRLTLGTGLRYFEDDQDYSSYFETVEAPSQAGKFHALSPRAYVQYKFTDQINTYASASKGFRSGGFNAVGQPPFGPETIWTYELGMKLSIGGGRLSFNPAVFYSNYTNYQINGEYGNPPIGVTGNGGNALIKGIEWALDWRPADQWTLSFNGDYLKSAFTKINAADTAYDVGDPLDFTPKYEFTVSAQRDFACVSAKACFARLDYNEQGRSTDRSRSIGPWYFSESDVIHMLNFNSGLQWNQNLSLGLSVQNLLNDRGYTDADVIDHYATRARSRTYGVKFGVKF
jgi:outer membrane receptor protein involved in Fe transport